MRVLTDRVWFDKAMHQFKSLNARLDMSCFPTMYDLPQDLDKMEEGKLFFVKSPDWHGGRVGVVRHHKEEVKELMHRLDSKLREEDPQRKTSSESLAGTGLNFKWVAQDYISPLLFEGRKFHIRLFVVITGLNPLKVWMLPNSSFIMLAHENHTIPTEGVEISQDQLFKDITNHDFMYRNMPAEIEKHPDRYWKVFETLHELGEDTWTEILKQIKYTVATSMMVAAPSFREASRLLPHQRSCFEVMGYDLLLDSEKRVKLLEINRSPSMGAYAEVKRLRKSRLLGDVLCLAGIGCERATVHPGAIQAEEADTLGDGDPSLSDEQSLERERKRGARTMAVQVLPDEEVEEKLEPALREATPSGSFSNVLGWSERMRNVHNEL
eukprot:gnl/TRDRNA2_/TRDRNA2_174693_c1_seq6.p1 gnl/TRDRNA2_/TRDRNA2_174693_c1~~gnl/TRDRNA2_/TRDRNA2_174693_c1_seq6.p1  ORF type:complete len:425 (+),score=56.41 gnl/TRDRNA2_/TRDRNA2_174693_c1_seq6:133-1275(+)